LTLVALDVHYLDSSAVRLGPTAPPHGAGRLGKTVREGGLPARAAAVVFEHWTSSEALEEGVVSVLEVSQYIPGEFYRRELPCLLAALEKVSQTPEIIVVDGYVWLDNGKPGLGAKLFEALEGKVAVVGVAKTRYAEADALEVLRGSSASPLFVSAVGMNALEAAQNVRQMHGPHRLPTLLTRVDRLCRSLAL